MTWSSPTTRLLGLIAGVVAAWGGILVFAGPSFSFPIVGSTSAWVWNSYHATVWFVAGVAGIAGGLAVLLGWTRMVQAFGALLTAVAGVWFLIGPSLAQTWTTAPRATIGASSGSGTRALEGIGYSYATGALVLLIGAFTLGLLAWRRERTVEPEVTVARQQVPAEPKPAPSEPATMPSGHPNGQTEQDRLQAQQREEELRRREEELQRREEELRRREGQHV
jgi:signal transduction histidine kinase